LAQSDLQRSNASHKQLEKQDPRYIGPNKRQNSTSNSSWRRESHRRGPQNGRKVLKNEPYFTFLFFS